jgi:hypothetical protein
MSAGLRLVSGLPKHCKKLGLFLQSSRWLCFVAMSLVVVGASAATLSEEKGYVRSQFEEKTKEKAMQIAIQLAPVMLDKMGLGFLSKLLEDGSAPAEQINYEKIGQIFSVELKKHDLMLSQTINKSKLKMVGAEFNLLEIPTNRSAKENETYGLRLMDLYDTLMEVKSNLEPYLVESIYTVALVDTLLMKIHSTLAMDRRLLGPHNNTTLEKKAGDMVINYPYRNYGRDKYTLLEERIEKLKCNGSKLSDTMNSNDLYTDTYDNNTCIKIRDVIREQLVSIYRKRNTAREKGDAEVTLDSNPMVSSTCGESVNRYQVVPTRDGFENVVAGKTCVKAHLYIAGQYYISVNSIGLGDVMARANQNVATLNKKLIDIGTDAWDRNDYVLGFTDVWYKIQEAARLAQIKLSVSKGEQVSNFTISNNSTEDVDIKWHGPDGSTRWVASIRPGKSIGRIPSKSDWTPGRHDWFGIYSMQHDINSDGSTISFANDSRNDRRRMKLLCNFQLRTDTESKFDSLDPTVECNQVLGMKRDKTTLLFNLEASHPIIISDGPFLMQNDVNSGKQVHSLPMKLGDCLETCQARVGCKTVRVSKEEESTNIRTCLLGLEAGLIDPNFEMDSYSADLSRQFDVLIN